MNEFSFKLPAYAKINWFLRVLGVRDDGFHELCTMFQTVSLHDDLSFAEDAEIILTCDDARIPVDENNLIVRAALRLKKEFKIEMGARIHLEKNIPSPGGLGGGSADAAVTLIGLARLWNLKIDREKFCEIGASLGSDVPFFFYGGTALGAGRGTEITPVEDINEKFLLIVAPAVDVSTAEAFARLNAARLTNSGSKSILEICRNEAARQHSRQITPTNDFERVIFKIEPEIERVKHSLLETGAHSALMSGSGASVCGVFDNEETRQATIKALENESSWRRFAVATVSRGEYCEALKVVSD